MHETGRTIRDRRRRCGGFTLLEALVAGVILAAVGVVVGGAVVGSLRSSEAGRDYAIAAHLLDDTMTRVDLLGPVRLLSEGPTSGTFAPPHERFHWSLRIEDMALPDLFEVELTVSWQTPGGERSAVAATRLYDPVDSRNPLIHWEDL